jgi:hypothetical protein
MLMLMLMLLNVEMEIVMKESVMLIVVSLLLGSAWYFLWIEPRDEFLSLVMDCMGNETSESAYKECADYIRG